MILDRILDAKREEVARARATTTVERLRESPLYAEARRGFTRALGRPGRRVVAEIKKASPSKGVIRDQFDPPAHAVDYENAGAACISVLTDEKFFAGSLEHLRMVRGACALPLLRKDFTIDGYQIEEARAAGADAVLLIVAALSPGALSELGAQAGALGLDVLVEVHDEAEMSVALDSGASLIGINNRNLRTFETSTDVTRRLIKGLPARVTVVSESGLGDRAELAELESLGVHAFLIGETFMKAARPGEALASLLRP